MSSPTETKTAKSNGNGRRKNGSSSPTIGEGRGFKNGTQNDNTSASSRRSNDQQRRRRAGGGKNSSSDQYVLDDQSAVGDYTSAFQDVDVPPQPLHSRKDDGRSNLNYSAPSSFLKPETFSSGDEGDASPQSSDYNFFDNNTISNGGNSRGTSHKKRYMFAESLPSGSSFNSPTFATPVAKSKHSNEASPEEHGVQTPKAMSTSDLMGSPYFPQADPFNNYDQLDQMENSSTPAALPLALQHLNSQHSIKAVGYAEPPSPIQAPYPLSLPFESVMNDSDPDDDDDDSSTSSSTTSIFSQTSDDVSLNDHLRGIFGDDAALVGSRHSRDSLSSDDEDAGSYLCGTGEMEGKPLYFIIREGRLVQMPPELAKDPRYAQHAFVLQQVATAQGVEDAREAPNAIGEALAKVSELEVPFLDFPDQRAQRRKERKLAKRTALKSMAGKVASAATNAANAVANSATLTSEQRELQATAPPESTTTRTQTQAEVNFPNVEKNHQNNNNNNNNNNYTPSTTLGQDFIEPVWGVPVEGTQTGARTTKAASKVPAGYIPNTGYAPPNEENVRGVTKTVYGDSVGAYATMDSRRVQGGQPSYANSRTTVNSTSGKITLDNYRLIQVTELAAEESDAPIPAPLGMLSCLSKPVAPQSVAKRLFTTQVAHARLGTTDERNDAAREERRHVALLEGRTAARPVFTPVFVNAVLILSGKTGSKAAITNGYPDKRSARSSDPPIKIATIKGRTAKVVVSRVGESVMAPYLLDEVVVVERENTRPHAASMDVEAADANGADADGNTQLENDLRSVEGDGEEVEDVNGADDDVDSTAEDAYSSPEQKLRKLMMIPWINRVKVLNAVVDDVLRGSNGAFVLCGVPHPGGQLKQRKEAVAVLFTALGRMLSVLYEKEVMKAVRSCDIHISIAQLSPDGTRCVDVMAPVVLEAQVEDERSNKKSRDSATKPRVKTGPTNTVLSWSPLLGYCVGDLAQVSLYDYNARTLYLNKTLEAVEASPKSWIVVQAVVTQIVYPKDVVTSSFTGFIAGEDCDLGSTVYGVFGSNADEASMQVNRKAAAAAVAQENRSFNGIAHDNNTVQSGSAVPTMGMVSHHTTTGAECVLSSVYFNGSVKSIGVGEVPLVLRLRMQSATNTAIALWMHSDEPTANESLSVVSTARTIRTTQPYSGSVKKFFKFSEKTLNKAKKNQKREAQEEKMLSVKRAKGVRVDDGTEHETYPTDNGDHTTGSGWNPVKSSKGHPGTSGELLSMEDFESTVDLDAPRTKDVMSVTTVVGPLKRQDVVANYKGFRAHAWRHNDTKKTPPLYTVCTVPSMKSLAALRQELEEEDRLAQLEAAVALGTVVAGAPKEEPNGVAAVPLMSDEEEKRAKRAPIVGRPKIVYKEFPSDVLMQPSATNTPSIIRQVEGVSPYTQPKETQPLSSEEAVTTERERQAARPEALEAYAGERKSVPGESRNVTVAPSKNKDLNKKYGPSEEEEIPLEATEREEAPAPEKEKRPEEEAAQMYPTAEETVKPAESKVRTTRTFRRDVSTDVEAELNAISYTKTSRHIGDHFHGGSASATMASVTSRRPTESLRNRSENGDGTGPEECPVKCIVIVTPNNYDGAPPSPHQPTSEGDLRAAKENGNSAPVPPDRRASTPNLGRPVSAASRQLLGRWDVNVEGNDVIIHKRDAEHRCTFDEVIVSSADPGPAVPHPPNAPAPERGSLQAKNSRSLLRAGGNPVRPMSAFSQATAVPSAFTRSSTLAQLTGLFAGGRNVALLGADTDAASTFEEQPVWKMYQHALEKVLHIKETNGSECEITLYFSLVRESKQVYDLLSPATGHSVEVPMTVGISPLFGPLLATTTGVPCYEPRTIATVITKALRRASSTSSRNCLMVANAVLKESLPEQEDVVTASFFASCSLNGMSAYEEIVNGDSLCSALFQFALGGPSSMAYVVRIRRHTTPTSIAPLETANTLRALAGLPNCVARRGSVRDLVEVTSAAMQEVVDRLQTDNSVDTIERATLQVLCAQMQEVVVDHEALLVAPVACDPKVYIVDIPGVSNTVHSTTVGNEVSLGRSAADHNNVPHVRPLTIVTHCKRNHRSRNRVSIDVKSSEALTVIQNGFSVNFNVDEVIENTDGSAFVNSTLLEDAANMYLDGYNVALLTADGKYSTAALTVVRRVVHGALKNLSEGAEVHVSVVDVAGNMARDLLNEDGEYLDLAVSSSPLFGPCVQFATFSRVSTAREFDSLVRSAMLRCDGDNPLLIVNAVLKQVREEDDDVIVNSLFSTLVGTNMELYLSIFTDDASYEMRELFRLALGGSCQTIAAFGVTDEDDNPVDILSLQDKLCAVRGLPMRVGSVQRLIAVYNQSIERVRASPTLYNDPSMEVERLKKIRDNHIDFLNNPANILPPVYPCRPKNHQEERRSK